MLSPVLTLLAATLPAAFAQFVQPPTDLKTAKGYAGVNVRYKQVPTGICETRRNVKSFAGYADVDNDKHVFFWFFEAREVDPHVAPLTVWINGGPGSSSMIGLFQENGPCGVNIDGEVVDNPYSWNRRSNMIYIDHPATVGFSYTKPIRAYLDPNSEEVIPLNGTGCPAAANGTCGTYSVPDESLVPNSTPNAAPSFWKTLQGFMGAFKRYSGNGFHFASESYGGHYGPIFNDYILQQNSKLPYGAHHIDLRSVSINNGWYDPLVQYPAYYNYTVYPGNPYDYDPYNQSTKNTLYNNLYGQGQCIDQLEQCAATGANDDCSSADEFCATNVEFPYDDILMRDEYDMRELTPDPFPYSFYVDYLNTEKVQRAVGAFVNFSEYSATVGGAFGETGDDGREIGTLAALRSLLRQDINVFLWAGDADYNCNYIGNEVVAGNVGARGFNRAGYADICTSDGITHGVVKQSGSFIFARIYNAGHEVPFYQPLVSLEVFERAISGRDIETGRIPVTDGLITRGPSKSTYREGNSTMQYEVLPPDATYNTTTNMPNPYRRDQRRMVRQKRYRVL